MDTHFFERLVTGGTGKIVMLVLDGLGGLPRVPGGKTELETARTPNLDALAEQSTLGLSQPCGPGVTVGSGPGHLALFGYDPVQYEIGRGALEALGGDFELGPDDLAARGNFCTLDEQGLISDRRAGRLPSEQSRDLARLLGEIRMGGAEFFILPVKEHRFAWVMRAPGLSDALSESDPLRTGLPPLAVQALAPEAEKAACYVNEFLQAARVRLAGCSPANMITLRGFNTAPRLPSFGERYHLKAASIAVNGMYRGVSKLAGMTVLDVDGATPADEFACLERHWETHDFFYLHIKQTDTCGESGDFDGKVAVIEAIDALLPRLMALEPEVVIVTGDHSSPAVMKAHSWHPVPALLYARRARAGGVAEFGERACAHGGLGVFPATQLMPLALAHAGRVAKYGA